jgi:hypothetical protein
VGGSVSCWVSDTGNLIPGHFAPRGFANLALQSGIEGAFDDHDEDVAAPVSPASDTGMAPLDCQYDHAAADGARRSLRPEKATAVGQIMTMAIQLPRVKFAAP